MQCELTKFYPIIYGKYNHTTETSILAVPSTYNTTSFLCSEIIHILPAWAGYHFDTSFLQHVARARRFHPYAGPRFTGIKPATLPRTQKNPLRIEGFNFIGPAETAGCVALFLASALGQQQVEHNAGQSCKAYTAKLERANAELLPLHAKDDDQRNNDHVAGVPSNPYQRAPEC